MGQAGCMVYQSVCSKGEKNEAVETVYSDIAGNTK